MGQLKNLSHFDNLQIRKELKFPITYNFISRLISKMEKMAVFRILIILSISIASTIAKPASITGTTSEVVLITGGFSNLEGRVKTSEILNGPEGCTMPDLPNRGNSAHNMIMTANNDILTCGGVTYRKKCYKYDKKNQDWIPHSDLKQGREDAASITMPNAVYLFGGQFENTYEYMVNDENVWQEGKTTIPGGFSEGCVVKLNTATKVFTENWGRLKQPRHSHACVTLGNNILVVGGFGASSGSELINIEDGRQSETDVGDLNSKRHN